MPFRFRELPVDYPPYRSRSVQALVELHEHCLRDFVETWSEAKDRGLRLPESEDPDYRSLDALLLHVVSAAGGYLSWLHRSLGLPGADLLPGSDPLDSPSEIRDRVEDLLAAWRTPLAGLEEENLYRPGYPTRRGVETGIEGMLQHAVMHPLRHQYQLQRLLDAS